MANPGYPGAYAKGAEITNLKAAEEMADLTVFQAGTSQDNGRLIATGGRVLNVTATGATDEIARTRAYAGVGAINWPGAFYRKDIGL